MEAMVMAYGWIITRDVLDEEDPKFNKDHGFKSAVGISGPRGVQFTDGEILKGKEFKMYDDDMNLYYIGKIIGDYSGLEPLDDFGTPNAGCTSIWYNGVRL
jgi:hypothetical protein